MRSVREPGASRTKPGSIGALVVAYYRSPQFRSLKASTQTTRRNIIERFREEHGELPVAKLSRKHLVTFMGAKAGTPQAANNWLKVVKLLLDLAVDLGDDRGEPGHRRPAV